MKIRAIETKVDGVYMRSRLEARWAVWFKAMGIRYNYEIVGVMLGDVAYLPDFVLPDFGWHVEIKPSELSRQESERLAGIVNKWQTAFLTLGTLAIIQGVPSFGAYTLRLSDDDTESELCFADCRRCDGVCYNGRDILGNVGDHTCVDNDRRPDEQGERIMRAYEIATRIKFDHACAACSG